jgi:hypothetical protein
MALLPERVAEAYTRIEEELVETWDVVSTLRPDLRVAGLGGDGLPPSPSGPGLSQPRMSEKVQERLWATLQVWPGGDCSPRHVTAAPAPIHSLAVMLAMS